MRGVVALSVALAGCYSPQPAPGAPCGPDEVCPSGLVCTLGTCERMPTDAQAPDDASDAATDAPAGTLDIRSVTPASGIVGTSITIAGAGFGPTAGTLALDTEPIAVESWSDTMIVATVPDVYPHEAVLTVVGADGLTGTAAFTIVLPPAVYVSNDIGTPDTVTVMRFDTATGSLTALGQPRSKQAAGLAARGCLQTLVVNERTRRVFTTADDALAVFDIDPRTGDLTHLTTASIPSGRSLGVNVNAAGTRVYVASPNQGRIAGFTITPEGDLASLPGSPYSAGGNVEAIVFSLDETFLYASQSGGGLVTFRVDPAGVLTRVGSVGTTNAVHVRRRPGTGQLFLAGAGSISVFSTPAGSPAPLVGSPFSADNLNGAPTFDLAQDRLYVPREGSAQIYAYDLSTNGVPTDLAASPFNILTGDDFSCGAISRDGTILVVAGERTREVHVFRLGAQGDPSPVEESPFRFDALETDVSGLAITF